MVAIALLMAVLAALLVSLAGGADDDPEVRSIGSGGASTTTIAMAPPTLGAPRAIGVTAAAANGRTRIERSLPCDGSQGDAGYWHLQAEQPLPAGVLTGPGSTVPGDLRLFADVHSPHHTIRVAPEPVATPGPIADAAYLLPDASRVALSNARGTVKLGLAAGACPPGPMPLAFDGTHASGGGTWTILSSSGAYRDAVADGTFSLDADVRPGADNPWSLRLDGAIQVLQPQLDVRLHDVYWGRDGVDYASRQVAAVYQITNIGAGDSFGAALTAASSSTPGASIIRITINGEDLLPQGNTPLGGFPRSIGDLASGEQVLMTVVWQLPLPAAHPPCKKVIFGCEIATDLTFSTPDALDLPVVTSVSIPVKAPNLPPPA